MRKINRYKIHTKLQTPLQKSAKRMLKFNRPKWFVLKDRLKRVDIKKIYLTDNTVLSPNSNKTENVKHYARINLVTKRMLRAFYDNSLNINKLQLKVKRRKKLKKESIKTYLVDPQYKLDIFLYFSNIYSSVFEARQAINNKNVFINGESIKPNVSLKKGDIISFPIHVNSIEKYKFKEIVDKFTKNNYYCTYAEIDYFTKSIIILKNPDEISNQDIYFMCTQYILYKNLNDSKL